MRAGLNWAIPTIQVVEYSTERRWEYRDTIFCLPPARWSFKVCNEPIIDEFQFCLIYRDQSDVVVTIRAESELDARRELVHRCMHQGRPAVAIRLIETR